MFLWCYRLFGQLLVVAALVPAAGEPDTVVRWIQQHAIPLSTVQAHHGFDDLRPLDSIVKDARIVELGEATHGTREFFQLKHRLLEYLATNKGFTIFSIEANMPEAYRLNDFVLHGTGDPRQLLKGMYFWTWDTEEVLDMILWMREYNRSGKGRVEFTGFDMQTPTLSLDIVQQFVRQHDPAYLSLVTSVYRSVRQDFQLRAALSVRPAPASQPSSLQAIRLDSAALIRECKDIRDHLANQRSSFELAGFPRQDVEWAIQNANLILQYAKLQTDSSTRDRNMAENIQWIADQSPDAKLIVWAHNGHVSYHAGAMGSYLRQTFGGQLVNFGFAFDQGSFQASAHQYLTNFTASPAPPGSWDERLAASGVPLFALDLRLLPKIGPVADWTRESHLTRSIGAVYDDTRPQNFFIEARLPGLYDALLFVEKTTAAQKNP